MNAFAIVAVLLVLAYAMYTVTLAGEIDKRTLRLKRLVKAAATEYDRGFALGLQAGYERGYEEGADAEVLRWSDAEDIAREEGREAGFEQGFETSAAANKKLRDQIIELKAELAKKEIAHVAKSRR